MKKIMNNINFVRGCDPRIPDQRILFTSFQKQMELYRKYDMPYTVLYQYDSMVKPHFAAETLNHPDKNMEIGVWIELARELVEKCGIKWRGRPGYDWDWHVNPGFLLAYTPTQRENIIDELFETFKGIFGYYPKSVGSWMLDTHSIRYMSEKYGIDAVCYCKEQYGTDGYTFWGGYYNQGYYPSKKNMYIPASTPEMQINVPAFRMLGIDPIYQYECGLDEKFNPSSLQVKVYTIEPACAVGQDPSWVDWYLKNNYGNECLTWSYSQVGQENSFTWDIIGDALKMQFEKIYKGVKNGEYEMMTLGETGRWFKKTFSSTPASAVVSLEDWKNEGRQAAWYNCKNYRTCIYTENGHVMFRDMFLFNENYEDRYLYTPDLTESGFYDAWPVVDGYRWGGNGIRCAMGFVKKGTCDDIPGSITEVTKKDDETLVCRLTSGDAVGEIVCTPDGITVDFGTADAELLIKYNNTANTEISVKNERELWYNYENNRYALKAEDGKITKERFARITPEGRVLHLSFIK